MAREGEAETRLGRNPGGGERDPRSPGTEQRKNPGSGSRSRAPVSQSCPSLCVLFLPLSLCLLLLWVYSRGFLPGLRPLCPANFTDSFWSLGDSRRPTVFMEVGSTFSDMLRTGFLCREGRKEQERNLNGKRACCACMGCVYGWGAKKCSFTLRTGRLGPILGHRAPK